MWKCDKQKVKVWSVCCRGRQLDTICWMFVSILFALTPGQEWPLHGEVSWRLNLTL